MLFKTFAKGFFQYLNINEVGYSVLRNHEELPVINIGRDIDILLEKEDTEIILSYLSNLPNVVITGITRRDFITVVYLHGIEQGNNKGLELDFIHKLSYKGLDYLPVADVLQRSKLNDNNVYIPNVLDEGLITFYSCYLLSGVLKEKYSEIIKSVFIKNRNETIKIFDCHFGSDLSEKVFEFVESGDVKSLLGILPKCRKAFMLKAFLKSPIKVIKDKVKHYWSEINIYRNNANTLRIAFLGPDGAGKSTIIDNLVTENQGVANLITVTHLKPSIFFKTKIEERGVVTNPHEVTKRGHFTSILKLIFWVVEFRIDALRRRRNFGLEIYDRYYHDLYIDSTRYLYGSHPIFIRFFEFFIPKVDAFFVLAAPAAIIQSRKKEVSFIECERQVLAYENFSNIRSNSFLFDTSQPPNVVSKNVEMKLIEFMHSNIQGECLL